MSQTAWLDNQQADNTPMQMRPSVRNGARESTTRDNATIAQRDTSPCYRQASNRQLDIATARLEQWLQKRTRARAQRRTEEANMKTAGFSVLFAFGLFAWATQARADDVNGAARAFSQAQE